MRVPNVSTKVSSCLFSFALLLGAAPALHASDDHVLILTASNASENQLLVYDAGGKQVQALSTHGKGGVASNSGGIEVKDGVAAVVNFGSQSVSVFKLEWGQFEFKHLIATASSPVSVAFGHDHLYILGTTTVESHWMSGRHVSEHADGVVHLFKADGSAAQVGVLPNQLIITERSNIIETVDLMDDGSVGGAATEVKNIPANVNVPFGLITRGNDAYVTIAHANEISLVRNDDVLTITVPGAQMAPCWLALEGPFLFSSNSPSKTISRLAVYGQKIVLDKEIAATLSGTPTDIDTDGKLLAVIDGSGHLTIFDVDEDGNLTWKSSAAISTVANGAVIVHSEE